MPCTLTLPQSPSRSSGSPIREIRGAVAMGRTGCLWCRGDQCPPRITWEVFPWNQRGVLWNFPKKHPVESFGRDDLLEPFFVWVIFVSSKWLKRFFVQESPLFGGQKRAEQHVVSHRFFHKSMHFSMHQWLCELVTGELWAWRFIKISCHSMFVDPDGSRWTNSLGWVMSCHLRVAVGLMNGYNGPNYMIFIW